MNLLTKTAPWVMGSLLAAVSAFGQTNSKCPPAQKNMNQGDELVANQYMAAYNAPARIDVRGAWDFYGTAAFTYWQPIQDNMELGVVDDTSNAHHLHNGNVINMDFGYKPGFKVGAGMNFDHDNWDGFAQYTWFRGTSSTSSTQSESLSTTTIRPKWGVPTTDRFFAASESWRLHMDLADLELARSYYNGMSLTFRPFFGVRGAWIRQHASVDYTRQQDALTTSRNISEVVNSWGVGPRAGIYSNWLIGEGFRVYGNGAADLLYTRYTHIGFKQLTPTAGVISTDDISLNNQRDLGTVRTHLELELGLGWGTYFDNNNWHVDVSAGYGFQVFFNQNMFKQFTDRDNLALNNNPCGNLYMQGMTATARFDF